MLTSEDIDILLEALDSWVVKDRGVELLSDIIFAKISNLASPELEKVMEGSKREAMENEKERDRKVIRLKAKLVDLQDRMMDSKSELKVGDLIGC